MPEVVHPSESIRMTKETLLREISELESRLKQGGNNTGALRELVVRHSGLADLLADRGQPGDAEQALMHYRVSLELSEGLRRANPNSVQAARDLAVGHSKLADFLVARGQPGDAEEALLHYRVALEIREGLRRENPDSAQFQRDVSVSLDRLGDFLVQRGRPGDADEALMHYRVSLELSEGLRRANPNSVQAARDLAVGHSKLADFLVARGQPGDAEEALLHYRVALEIREGLRRENPDSAQFQRDVSVSLDRLGDFLVQRGQPGDAEQALGFYQRSLAVSEQLLADNPQSAQAARDVSVSLNKLADYLASRGQPGDADKALGHYQRSLEVAERLLAANPESAQAARDVMVSLERMAAFEGGRAGGETKALEFQTRALGIAIKLHEGNPQSVYYGRTAAVSFFLTFQRAQAAGQEELAKQCLAGCFSVLDSLVQAGAELDPPMRQLHAQLAPLFRDGQ